MPANGLFKCFKAVGYKGEGKLREKGFNPPKNAKNDKIQKKTTLRDKRSGFALAGGGKPYALREYISTDLFVVALMAWFVNLEIYLAIRVLSSSVVLTRLM